MRRAARVALYAAFGGEIPTRAAVRGAAARCRSRGCFPRIERRRDRMGARATSGKHSRRARSAILEPLDRARSADTRATSCSCRASRSTGTAGASVAAAATTTARFPTGARSPVARGSRLLVPVARARFRTIREIGASMRSSPSTDGSGARGSEMSSTIADEVARQLAVIRDGAVQLFGEEELRAKLAQSVSRGQAAARQARAWIRRPRTCTSGTASCSRSCGASRSSATRRSS